MEITYWELAWMLVTAPGFVFVGYWKGFARGKREGWIAGRSLMRVPMDMSK